MNVRLDQKTVDALKALAVYLKCKKSAALRRAVTEAAAAIPRGASAETP